MEILRIKVLNKESTADLKAKVMKINPTFKIIYPHLFLVYAGVQHMTLSLPWMPHMKMCGRMGGKNFSKLPEDDAAYHQAESSGVTSSSFNHGMTVNISGHQAIPQARPESISCSTQMFR